MEENKGYSLVCKIITGLIIIALVIILVKVLKSPVVAKAFRKTLVRFLKWAERLLDENFTGFVTFFFMGHIVYNLVFIPGHSTYSIVMSFL